jgi:predicted HAD superfamily phosphohydrolase YqeG
MRENLVLMDIERNSSWKGVSNNRNRNRIKRAVKSLEINYTKTSKQSK